MPKQVIIQPSIEAVEIIDTPIPIPKDKEVVIKVVVSGTNPKDWKYPLWKNWPHNSGDDIAGIVHSVGKDVYEFKLGDRVAAMHQAGKENGSFAEYSVAPDWTTFHIPQNVTFEEAATVPTAALTAAMALYADMKLPGPHDTVEPSFADKAPILIYGVTSAVGAFAAKLARLSGLHPIIGVAGRAGDYARTLVDHVVDHRHGEDAVVASVKDILKKEGLGSKVSHVFDAISEGGTLEATLRFLDPNGGTVSTVLPPKLFAKDKENFEYPPGVTAINSALPLVHSTHKDFGYIWSRYLGRLLEDGRLKPHPFEIIPGGLHGVLTGLQKLRDGEASAVNYDSPGH
ncbi:GroES-like protein [Xylariaceae sp. AK1471]|nr:GroES-like protein [Xylariaceae sp. AK1471]